MYILRFLTVICLLAALSTVSLQSDLPAADDWITSDVGRIDSGESHVKHKIEKRQNDEDGLEVFECLSTSYIISESAVSLCLQEIAPGSPVVVQCIMELNVFSLDGVNACLQQTKPGVVMPRSTSDEVRRPRTPEEPAAAGECPDVAPAASCSALSSLGVCEQFVRFSAHYCARTCHLCGTRRPGAGAGGYPRPQIYNYNFPPAAADGGLSPQHAVIINYNYHPQQRPRDT